MMPKYEKKVILLRVKIIAQYVGMREHLNLIAKGVLGLEERNGES